MSLYNLLFDNIIIVSLIIGFGIGIPLAIFLTAIAAEVNNNDTKKKAIAFLAGERTMPKKHIELLSKYLATMPNDLEAADLWRKLQEFRCQTAKKF